MIAQSQMSALTIAQVHKQVINQRPLVSTNKHHTLVPTAVKQPSSSLLDKQIAVPNRLPTIAGITLILAHLHWLRNQLLRAPAKRMVPVASFLHCSQRYAGKPWIAIPFVECAAATMCYMHAMSCRPSLLVALCDFVANAPRCRT